MIIKGVGIAHIDILDRNTLHKKVHLCKVCRFRYQFLTKIMDAVRWNVSANLRTDIQKETSGPNGWVVNCDFAAPLEPFG